MKNKLPSLAERNNMRLLLVGGDFTQSHQIGRQSSLFRKIVEPFFSNKMFTSITYINGGTISDIMDLVIERFNIIIWAANISNDINKDLITTIKTRNPHCLLISTKRNKDGEYDVYQIINHALKIKSNLIIEFQTSFNPGSSVSMRLLDPLGNCYYSGMQPDLLNMNLIKRMDLLLGFTRKGTVQISKDCPHYVKPNSNYLEIIRKHGKKFQSFLTGESEDSTRFLGNTSFRCIYGFPSMRVDDNYIMVSKRNLDKSTIDENSFVPVKLSEGKKCEYEGEFKPSVDTPIQVALYQKYPNINYMLHSHVYAKDGLWVGGSPIPCGCLEEIYKILAIVPVEVESFIVNIKGHGCIVAGKDYSQLEDIKFFPRDIPEVWFL